MERTQSNTLDAAVIRLGGRVTSWVLGAGLLSLHATTFTLAMVTMVFWNIYDSPRDLWVGEVFRRWGALLAFHAIVVAAGWAVWKLMRAEQRAMDAAGRQWAPVLPEPLVYPVEPGPSATATWTAVPPFRPEPTRARSSAPRQAWIFLRQTVMTWIEWSNALGRFTIRASGATTTMIRTRAHRGQPVEAQPGAPEAAWPPPVDRGDNEAFIARFTPHLPPNGDTPGAATVVSPATDDLLTAATLAEEAQPRPPVIPVVKDANATWVETATAIWLPRPAEPGASEHQNGHHPQPELVLPPDAPPPPTAG